MDSHVRVDDKLKDLQVGYELPEREHTPDNVQSFLYNAALWNAHRIHFDHPYTKNVEGYPGLVIAGPLLGDWLNQCVNNWLGEDGRVVSIKYSNRKASYVGETVKAGGKVIEIDRQKRRAKLEVYIKNENDEIIAPGEAVVEFY